MLFIQNSNAQTIIPDNSTISGSWTLSDSPYVIQGRAIVPNGQTLTIEPGVEIRLTSSTSSLPSWFEFSSGNIGVIRVQGEIIANGTAANPILFTRDNLGFWGSILIDENASSSSSFTNCIIEYSKETRNVTGISAVVSFNAGISVFRTAISIDQNEFRNNNINGLYMKEVNTSMDFSNNLFFDNGASGVVLEESASNSINNTFYNNSIVSSGLVAAIRSSNSTTYIIGNLIYNNDDLGIFTTNGGNHYLINTTIYGNAQGVRVDSDANTFIHNSIIQNNVLNFATNSIGNAVIEMEFSLTDNINFPPNVVDVAGNVLSADALFTDVGMNDFSLQSSSPSIDSGNPSTVGLTIPTVDLLGNPRVDNTVIDMGAIEFQHPIITYLVTTSSIPSLSGTTSGGGTFANGDNVTVTATENSGFSFINWSENGSPVSTQQNYSFTISSDRDLVAIFEDIVGLEEEFFNDGDHTLVYPNPTKGVIKIEKNNFQFAEVYDIQGKIIATSLEKIIDLSDEQPGIYFLKSYSSNSVSTTKIIKN